MQSVSRLFVGRNSLFRQVFRMSSDSSKKRKAINPSHFLSSNSKKRKLHNSSATKLFLSVVKMESHSKTAASEIASAVHLPTPVKSENDKKNYRSLRLKNGMKVLLISDPHKNGSESEVRAIQGIENLGYSSEDGDEDVRSDDEEEDDGEEEGEECEEEESEEDEESDEEEPSSNSETVRRMKKSLSGKEGERMAAASLCVNVGSFSDPPDLPGLAHFLEHMVFMGSDKYPQENALDEFVKTYGGSTNASTDYEYTTFELEIHQKYFYEALLVFAQFFASPLLRPESMKREKEAIDSEFRMALPSDSCRKQQLFASLAKTGHPMSVFSWGNSSTLNLPNDPDGTELNRRLRVFWEENYTADRMTLVLQSKHDLETLEEWATSIFKDIPTRSPSCHPDFSQIGSPFDTPQFNRILQVIPVKNVNQVCLSWALPSQLQHYDIKPLPYLSWLIGHEGKGSLLAYLRHKVWALDLTSGNDESGYEHNSTYALFSVNINLTQKGMDQIEEVICSVFQYIAMLKKNGPDARIWSEIQTIEAMSFRYIEDSPPVDYVESLSENMHKYSPEDYITGDSLMFRYDEKIIASCMEALRPDKVNIMILSKHYAAENICNETEPWFKTQYAVKDIPDEWMKMWLSAQPKSFSQPEANPYLTTDFSLLEHKAEDGNQLPDIPTQIGDPNEGFSLWYRGDNKFRLPKAIISFYLVSPIVTDSAKSAVMLDLLANMLKQQLMEEAYDALVAQLEFTIHSYDRGLVMKVSGFNHKLHVLLNVIVEHMKKFDQHVRLEVFNALKTEQEKNYRNFSLKPSKLVTEARLTLMHTGHWSVIDKYHAVNGIEMKDIIAFANSLKDTCYLECLVQGNYSKQQALDVVRHVKDSLRSGDRIRSPLPPIRICEVPIGQKWCRLASFHKTDTNSVVVNYYQTGPTNLRQMAVMEILVNLMEEPVFDVLRTQEQLGYNVYATLRNTFGVLGFSITVDFQVDKFSASHVDERIECFLQQFERRLTEMSESDLETRVTSLIKLKQRPDVSLDEEVSRNWNEILTEEYLFDRLEREVHHLRQINLEDIRTFYRRFAYSEDKSQRRKLSMQVVGRDKKEAMAASAASDSETDHKMELRFLTEAEVGDDFITDLSFLRKSAHIYPPLKTYNGLPDAEFPN